MDTILAFLQGHGIGALIVVFTVVSIALNALASIFQALGKTAPGWLGSVVTVIGNVLHFLNGNIPAAQKAAPPAA